MDKDATGSQSGLRDDLDILLDEVQQDPLAYDSYCRARLLSQMSKARREQNLSQADVAEAMGTQQPTVSELESGRRADPKLSTLQKLGRAVRRRLDFALVDPKLPILDQNMSETMWGLVAQREVGPILNALIVHRDTPLTMGALAMNLDLPTPVLRYLLDVLSERGWVDTDKEDPETRYSLRRDRAVVVGIDIRADGLVGVLTDLTGSRAVEGALLEDLGGRSPGEVAESVAHVVQQLLSGVDGRDVLGVGVGLAGFVAPATGIVTFAPDLASDFDRWNSVHLEEAIRAAIRRRLSRDLPTALENDANALALRESLDGNDECVVTVLLSRSGGIGGAVVAHGRLITGANHRAGKIGHVVLNPSGKPCRSGEHKGCLETVAGIRAILTEAGLLSDTDELLRALILASDRVNHDDEAGRLIIDAIRLGGRALGSVIASVVAILDPSKIVVYGDPELVDGDKHNSATIYTAGVADGLSEGSGRESAGIIEYRSLKRTTGAVAGSAALVHRYLIERPTSCIEPLFSTLA